MEHRFVVRYTLDGQDESLSVITETESLSFEEAKKGLKLQLNLTVKQLLKIFILLRWMLLTL